MTFHFLVLVDMLGATAKSTTLSVDAVDVVHAHAAAFDAARAFIRETWPRALSFSVLECERLEVSGG